MKSIAYSKAALRVLERIPATDSRRIREKVRQYGSDPGSLGNNVKKLVGSPYVRLRVGDWGVVMDDRGQILFVVKVGPRGSVYDE